jgi:N-methylhydantoinase B
MDRYGDATVAEAIAEMRVIAARQMRAELAAIPEGTFRAKAFLDSDGVVNEPLTIALAVTRAGGGDCLRFRGLLAAMPWPDELGPRHHLFLCLSGTAPHLP